MFEGRDRPRTVIVTRSGAASLRQADDGWTAHVRDTLVALQAELDSGMIQLEYDQGRYRLSAAGASGRDIVLPAHNWTILPPPSMPARDAGGLLSPFTIGEPSSPVRVPWRAVARDHGLRDPNLSLGGAWPHGRSLNPVTIVVLKLRGHEPAPVYGWFVSVPTPVCAHHLVPIPHGVALQCLDFLRGEPRLMRSTLVTRYALCADATLADTFASVARMRFARFRARVEAVVRAETFHRRFRALGKRPRVEATDATAEPPVVAADGARTCVLCFEDKPSAQARCARQTCGAAVCETCHAASRGLCPLCDRSAINADYPCSRCHTLHRLTQYGYPCIGCRAHSLCHECYGEFGECAACECGEE